MKSKNKIIFSHFKNPSNHVGMEELEKNYKNANIPYFCFKNSNGNCGDIIYLFLKNNNNFVEKALFNGEQSCLVTFAFADIFCSWIENKNKISAINLINNVKKMLLGKENNISECPKEILTFADITNFPGRIECINLVIKGFNKILELQK